eukprot:934064-Pleurochrysis_carterae.AAC.2
MLGEQVEGGGGRRLKRRRGGEGSGARVARGKGRGGGDVDAGGKREVGLEARGRSERRVSDSAKVGSDEDAGVIDRCTRGQTRRAREAHGSEGKQERKVGKRVQGTGNEEKKDERGAGESERV